jgi:hydroxymethylpyrimidine pyrophosphatase-like HAD family hydrolase
MEREPVAAFDLDGTVLEYDGNTSPAQFGPVMQGMVREMTVLRNHGWKIIIWTCRGEDEEGPLADYLMTQGVPFDAINTNIHGAECRKVHADVYVDDKGITFTGVSEGLAHRVMTHKPWWKVQMFPK